MNSKQIINEFRIAISGVKAAKRKTIRITALEHFLTELESEINESGEISKEQLDARLAKFSAENEHNLTIYKAENDRSIANQQAKSLSELEMFKSIILSGQSALKGALIINGGAAIAILAFIGNSLTKANQITTHQNLAEPLLLFTIGVLTSATSAGVTYLSQLAYSNFEEQNTGKALHVLAVLLIGSSYALFGCAAFIMKATLENLLTP
jgi:hypothetical protein